MLSDVCDQLGRRHQTAVPGIGRLVGRGVLVGWARTVRSVPVDSVPARPYGKEIDFIDSLQPGDVVVADVGAPAAFWGELFSSAAIGRGARGAIVDGLVRDVDRMAGLDFQIYGRGTRPTDSLGRISIEQADVPIECGGVLVSQGDLVVADRDGVTFVPRDLAAEALNRAAVKARTESDARQMLLGGATLAEAWERFRVL